MPRSALIPRKRSLALLAVLAGAVGLGLGTALPVLAQTPSLPARAAVAPPILPAVPAVPNATPPAATPSAAPGGTARPALPARGGMASPGLAAGSATARWVALDIGHLPGGGSRSASGVAEHNFNLRFATALEARLQRQGITVRRLPTSLSLAERARRAQGAALVVSVHHDGTVAVGPPRAGSANGHAVRKVTMASTGSGFQLRTGQAEPMACARAVATQLQSAGRHFSTGGAGPWADKALGVRAGGEGALLQQAEVPVLQVSLADIANPAEERLAGDERWVGRQAAAVAKGLGQCLQRPVGGGAPAVPPAAAASGSRRA